MEIYFRLNRKWYHEFIKVLQNLEIYGVYTTKVRDFPEPPDFVLKFVMNKSILQKKDDFIHFVVKEFGKEGMELVLLEPEEIHEIIGKTFEPEHEVRHLE